MLSTKPRTLQTSHYFHLKGEAAGAGRLPETIQLELAESGFENLLGPTASAFGYSHKKRLVAFEMDFSFALRYLNSSRNNQSPPFLD